MNFSEQLDQFVERGARDLFPCNPPCDSHGVCDNCVDAKLVRIGGASLKPIVLKLYNDLSECKAILMRQWGTEEKIMSLKGPPLERIILEALAEVEQMIEEG